jgi:hypothetical protein
VPEFLAYVQGSAWLLSLLRAARAVDAPDWWIGGGVLRDLVWDSQAGGFDPRRVKDVDLAFFDSTDLSTDREKNLEHQLAGTYAGVQWDAKNQAAVHTWYRQRFGIEVPPVRSTLEGVATWPETATAVAVRLDADSDLHVYAAYGLDDLLDAVCRRNPRRVTVEEYRRRVAAKQVATRWPHVRVEP